ncbi:deoxyribonuclease-4 [Scopulibacillus daqui]|uniref:Deoxyribonuclease-4 n=1 Tax=Scopulibacillus daqui TaxID=1469162 RepID=A0ABS2Q062_9BACL|nr:deoxyribonuclease IV [Scopulibacillus daqui]MBM7645578.1 deoxyribonuclease-4 [Scopulibacillus daqui]
MKFGCHISIRNGYFGCAKKALNIGAQAFQYFPKNPRSLKIKVFDRHDAESCAKFCAENQLVSIAHTSYPANLSSDYPKSKHVVESILNDLDISQACGSIGVVVHFGTFKGEDPLEGYKRMIETLNQICEKWDGDSLILLENNAGKSGQMGTTIEELAKIRQLVDYPEHIGFCLDTCHAYASGLWNGDNWNEVVKKGKTLGYFEHLKAVHLNNSMYKSGSKRDRHANINSGYIKEKQIKAFMESPVIKHLPMILETPAQENYTHKDEIAYLKALIHDNR